MAAAWGSRIQSYSHDRSFTGELINYTCANTARLTVYLLHGDLEVVLNICHVMGRSHIYAARRFLCFY